ncbi:MAG: AraC family transcriptional regulator [Gemmatimonadetes bacterium]|nr:AraC family transcriptional regulator [Gemmatimonadota bacterium]
MLLDGAPRRLFYGEQPPPEPFAEHVLALWSFDVRLPAGEVSLHTVWPDGCVSLSVVCSAGAPVAASVVGPRMRALRIPMRSGLTVRGIRLWPDTAAQVLGVDPVAIRDLSRPAAELLGVGALTLARAVARATDDEAVGAVWEQWLAPRIAAAALPDPAVRLVVRLLVDSDGAHDIADAARQTGLGLRQLERRFGAAVGLTPKQFARVRRVRATIGSILAGERTPARLAAMVALDQAHLTREFRSVAGVSPEQLMEQLDQIETSDDGA